MCKSTILVAATVLAITGGIVRADVFHLQGGGEVEGQLLNPSQNPRTSFLVKTRFGAQVTLAADSVAKVDRDSPHQDRYEQFLLSLPDTAEAHWDMATRCAQAGLKKERLYHLQRVLTFDPNHESARHALGYSQVNDRWVKVEEFRRRQGYSRYRGDWVLKQEKDLMMQADDRESEVVDWKKKIRMWRSWIIKARGQENEALAALRQIDRKRAAPALAELLKDDDEDPRLKLLYIEILGRLKSQVAVSAFIDRAMNDPDATVRNRCLDELEKFGGQSAIPAFTKALTNKSNIVVKRGAAGLARVGNEYSTMALIDALVTKHKQVIQPGSGNLGVGFSNGGLSGLSAGNRRPKVIERQVPNQSALTALTKIHPGVNFAFDKEEWRKWYSKKDVPTN